MVHLLDPRHAWAILISCGLLLAAVAAGTGWYVHDQQQQASRLLDRSVSAMRAAEELEIRTREIRTRLNQFVVTGDRANLGEIPQMLTETMKWLATAEQVSINPDETELTTRVRAGFELFRKEFLSIQRQLVEPNNTDLLKPQVSRLIDERITQGVLIHVHQFLDKNQNQIAQTIPVNQAAADRVGLTLAALGCIGAMAGLLFGYTLASRLHHSLVQLTVPVHDAAGRLSEVVGPINLDLTGSNLTKMKESLNSMADHVGEVVNRLQQSQREALRAEQLAAVGQLAAGMAHELRNPLTAIKMIVQSAVENPQSSGISGKNLTVLYEQILRQENSIRGFLDYARPPGLEVRSIDLVNVVSDCLHLLNTQAERQGVRIESRLPSDAICVEADGSQLRQVILNLVGNAIEILAGRGTITVRLSSETLASLKQTFGLDSPTWQRYPHWCLLSVCDTGPGLPENLGDRIFEPFVSTKETGVGLGLSICKRIVDLHGGVIVARNVLPSGAEFLVGLPMPR